MNTFFNYSNESQIKLLIDQNLMYSYIEDICIKFFNISEIYKKIQEGVSQNITQLERDLITIHKDFKLEEIYKVMLGMCVDSILELKGKDKGVNNILNFNNSSLFNFNNNYINNMNNSIDLNENEDHRDVDGEYNSTNPKYYTESIKKNDRKPRFIVSTNKIFSFDDKSNNERKLKIYKNNNDSINKDNFISNFIFNQNDKNISKNTKRKKQSITPKKAPKNIFQCNKRERNNSNSNKKSGLKTQNKIIKQNKENLSYPASLKDEKSFEYNYYSINGRDSLLYKCSDSKCKGYVYYYIKTKKIDLIYKHSFPLKKHNYPKNDINNKKIQEYFKLEKNIKNKSFRK